MYFFKRPSHWNRAGRVITESESESESILGRVGVGVGVVKHWCEVGKEVVWLRNLPSRFIWEASKFYCDKLWSSIKMFEDPEGLCLLMCKVVTNRGCDCLDKSLEVLDACLMLSICLMGRDLMCWGFVCNTHCLGGHLADRCVDV